MARRWNGSGRPNDSSKTKAERGILGRLPSAYCSLGRACLSLGCLDEARDMGRRAAEFSLRYPGVMAHAEHLLGDIATHSNRFDAEGGLAHYREALALAEPRCMRRVVARCHLGLGELFRRTGRSEEAREHLLTAATMFRDMGMRFWLEQVASGSRDPA